MNLDWLHRLSSYSSCFWCAVESLIRVWLWLELNALTCASISISIITAFTGTPLGSLHSWKDGCRFKRFHSGIQFETFVGLGSAACNCHVKERPNPNKSVSFDVKTSVFARKQTSCFCIIYFQLRQMATKDFIVLPCFTLHWFLMFVFFSLVCTLPLLSSIFHSSSPIGTIFIGIFVFPVSSIFSFTSTFAFLSQWVRYSLPAGATKARLPLC